MTELVTVALAAALFVAALLAVRRGAGRRRSVQLGARTAAFRHRPGCPTADAAVEWVPAHGGLEERRCHCALETRRPAGQNGVYFDGEGVTIVNEGRPREVPDRP